MSLFRILKKIILVQFLSVVLLFSVPLTLPSKYFARPLKRIKEQSGLDISFDKFKGNLRKIQLKNLKVSFHDTKVFECDNVVFKYSYLNMFLGHIISFKMLFSKITLSTPLNKQMGLKSIFSDTVILNLKGSIKNKIFYGSAIASLNKLSLFFNKTILLLLTSLLNLPSSDKISIEDISLHFEKIAHQIDFSNITASHTDLFKIKGNATYEYGKEVSSVFSLLYNLSTQTPSKMSFSICGKPSNLRFKNLE